jgi:hypothetical protein
LKADRDRAEAALERAKPHSSQAIQIDPALLEQFGRSMRKNFTSGSIPFRKAYFCGFKCSDLGQHTALQSQRVELFADPSLTTLKEIMQSPQAPGEYKVSGRDPCNNSTTYCDNSAGMMCCGSGSQTWC